MSAAFVVVVIEVMMPMLSVMATARQHVATPARVMRKKRVICRVCLKRKNRTACSGERKEACEVADVRSNINNGHSVGDNFFEQSVCFRFVKPPEHVELPAPDVICGKGETPVPREQVGKRIKRRIDRPVHGGGVHIFSVECSKHIYHMM